MLMMLAGHTAYRTSSLRVFKHRGLPVLSSLSRFQIRKIDSCIEPSIDQSSNPSCFSLVLLSLVLSLSYGGVLHRISTDREKNVLSLELLHVFDIEIVGLEGARLELAVHNVDEALSIYTNHSINQSSNRVDRCSGARYRTSKDDTASSTCTTNDIELYKGQSVSHAVFQGDFSLALSLASKSRKEGRRSHRTLKMLGGWSVSGSLTSCLSKNWNGGHCNILCHALSNKQASEKEGRIECGARDV